MAYSLRWCVRSVSLLTGLAWLVAIVVAPGVVGAQPQALRATIIDRQGNVHEVSKLTYGGRGSLECYVGGERRMVDLATVRRLRFDGERGDEEQALTITLQNGRTQAATMVTGAALAPHQDVSGGGGTALRFAGSTALGPFFILVSDVREVIMPEAPAGTASTRDVALEATVVTEDGSRFDVRQLECRGTLRMHYRRGNRRRFVDLVKVETIRFADDTAAEEQRPVTITYWSGKTIQGTVESGRVRLSGETDRSYFDRIHAVWTGKTDGGAIAKGMHEIKLIRFKRAAPPQAPAGESTSGD